MYPPQAPQQLSESEDEAIRDQLRQGIEQQEFHNDFDLMMAKKKELASMHRKKKSNVDIINDNEEHISIIVKKVGNFGYINAVLPLFHLYSIFIVHRLGR